MSNHHSEKLHDNVLATKISFFEAFKYWLKLGFISFGGPAGQISMMHQELVEKRRWISEKRFLHSLNYTMTLPGPEAQQLATYIGWLMHGVWGGIAAGALFVLPSLLILMLLTWIYLSFGELSSVQGILYGIKPAVTAIVIFAAYRIGSRALDNLLFKLIALAAFIGIFALNVPFPFIIIVAGLAGYIASKYLPHFFSEGKAEGEAASKSVPAIIDDDTPVPPHAQFKRSRLVSFAFVGLGLWGAALLALTLYFGWDGVLTQMAWFFSKAAMVTFGGAYAVLPYVYQGGVEHFQWLTATQMIDGLALGETTPGPLIMVVAYIGYVGAWTSEFLGTESQALAGSLGALTVTFFTFLPSFLFILIGGPFVEATRDNLKFTAPLKGITAAVVGVILNLALFFAYHVLWPEGLEAGIDFLSLVIGIAAFFALYKLNQGIVTVIISCALLGLTMSFF